VGHEEVLDEQLEDDVGSICERCVKQ